MRTRFAAKRWRLAVWTTLVQRSVVAALAMTMLGATALGQAAPVEPAGPWQISAFGGWYSGATPYVFKGAVSADARFESAPAFGLRLGRDIGRFLGVELSWTGARPELELATPQPAAIRRVSLDTWALDFRVYLGHGAVRGVATIGLGGARTGSSLGGANFTADLGLGLLMFLDRRFAVRVDARSDWSYGNIGLKGGSAYCDANGCYFYKRPWYPSAVVTAGLTYAF